MKARNVNSFDEVRFILAFIVLVSHTSALASADQLSWFTRFFDADFAVKGFFAISGFLVTKSYLSSKNYIQYFEKRIRRIYPAYVLVIAYCVFVGFITTNLSSAEFFFNPQFVKYLAANLAFLNFLQPNLPGAIAGNGIQALNGSLWTIKVELMLYFTVPVLCFLYAIIGKKLTAITAFVFGVVWFVYFSEFFNHSLGNTISRQFPGQLPFFALGSVLGFVTFNSRNSLIILGASLAYYLFIQGELSNPYREIANMIVYPLVVVLIATSNKLSIGIGRIGDWSYGIYLFHFPTIQMLEHFGVYTFNPYLGFMVSIVITFLLAAFSWHVVEKKFLRRSSHYGMAAKGQ